MSEFDLLSRILSRDFLVEKVVLFDEKSNQRAEIIDSGIDIYLVYRFDLDNKKDFLPFFSKQSGNTKEDKRLKGLTSFCDYIILVQLSNELFVLLVEMKSSKDKSSHAIAQLDATELFVDYIRSTAQRIAKQNSYNLFDNKSIILRKVILFPSKQMRHATNISTSTNIKSEGGHLVCTSSLFPLKRICKKY